MGIYGIRINAVCPGLIRTRLTEKHFTTPEIIRDYFRHIPLGRGICGAAAAEKATIIVDDVNTDPRYLACSLETKSEIVVPIMKGGEVLGEIDIDSDRLAAFGAADQKMLEAVAALLAERMNPPTTD